VNANDVVAPIEADALLQLPKGSRMSFYCDDQSGRSDQVREDQGIVTNASANVDNEITAPGSITVTPLILDVLPVMGVSAW
jgi:hypothetical protein